VTAGNNRNDSRSGGQSGETPLPAELVLAFEQAPEARSIFEAMPPSHQREYVNWVREAKRNDARERRAAQTIMRLLDS
jgi:uncharacterized protein YdeI (YjbR/CyaY-like superfamily)